MVKKIFLVVCLLFLLSGCFDYKELNDMSIVSSIGVDYIDNEYVVSFEITNSSKDGSSTEIDTNVVTSNDKNLSKAFNKVMNMCEKSVYLEHVELLIIGEDLAYKGISEVLDYIIRDTTINNNYFVVVGKNPSKLLESNDENKSMSEIIVDTVSYAQGKTNVEDLDIMASKLITKRQDIALPYIEDDDGIKYKMISYFNGDKMIDDIDYKIYSLLMLDTDNVLFTSEGNTINVYKKKVSYEIKDNKIIVKICGSGQIKEISKNINLKDKDSYGKLEKLINEQIKKEIIEFIDTVIGGESDLLGFKDLYYKKYKDIRNSFKYDVLVDVTVNKNGTIYEVLDAN